MNDMRSVIVPKSDQINADDLLSGPMTITVTKVAIRPGTEQPVSINFEGDNGKPYKPCKSMARVMVHCWGPDANQYEGRSMTLYCDPKVLWGGMAVGGIRISHMTDIKGTQVLALTATKGSKKPFTVQPLMMPADKPAEKKRTWGDFLDELEPRLLAALTGADVDAIVAEPMTQRASGAIKGNSKERFDKMISAAIQRVAAPVDDAPHDDDTPGDDSAIDETNIDQDAE